MLGDGGIFFTRDIGLHLLKGLLSHVNALHSRKKRQPFADSDNSNFLVMVNAVLKIKKLMTGTHGEKLRAGFWEILSSCVVTQSVQLLLMRVLLMPGNQRNADHLC